MMDVVSHHKDVIDSYVTVMMIMIGQKQLIKELIILVIL